MRLGFHDCIPYKTSVENGYINGCDGCLNPTGMNIDMFKEYGVSRKDRNRNAPDLTKTNNNGLLFMADVFEEVYTNPDFPKLSWVIFQLCR